MLTGNNFQYYRTINKFWFYFSSKSLQWCLNQQVILEFRYHYDSIIPGTGRRIIIILIWTGIFLCAWVRECQSCCTIRAGGRFDVCAKHHTGCGVLMPKNGFHKVVYVYILFFWSTHHYSPIRLIQNPTANFCSDKIMSQIWLTQIMAKHMTNTYKIRYMIIYHIIFHQDFRAFSGNRPTVGKFMLWTFWNITKPIFVSTSIHRGASD